MTTTTVTECYFEKIENNFTTVTIANGINTAEFLDAAVCAVRVFDKLGNSSFAVIQNDMNQNIKRIRDRHASNPTANNTLQNLLAIEAPEKRREATEGLLWLTRGLEFTAAGLKRSLDNPEEELSVSFRKAYQNTWRKHHNMLVRPIFSLAIKSCFYRKDFYENIGVQTDDNKAKMREWIGGIERVTTIIQGVFNANPNYSKGM
ncbi:glycolipid transfer protein [Backusella circina FSU 941]|nr:glycolipid transfer protein [Backusella circina FSU 941]